MIKWWDVKGNSSQNRTLNAIPNVILWFLWKKRNTIVHGISYSTNIFICDIINTTKNINNLKFKYPNISKNWPQMVALLDSLKPCFTSTVVRWSYLLWDGRNLTPMGHQQVPGPSTIEFFVMDSSGDLVGGSGLGMQETTNIVVVAMALKERLK